MEEAAKKMEKPVQKRILFIAAAAVITVILIFRNTEKNGEISGDEKSYTYHVAMISADASDIFWDSLYDEACRAGEESDIYPEDFGSELNEEYEIEDLVEMAIAAKVDGIVVESTETEEMQELLAAAADSDIPVVTLMNDTPESGRISYVGANSFTIGEMYGREVMKALRQDGTSAAVLIPVNDEDISPNYIYSGISETIAGASRNIQVTTVRTGEDNEFVSEESVRNLLLNNDTRPDAIVCLSATDTISAYQCVREYNLVGEVKIIGYYTSPEILEGIRNGVIESTVVVDADEAGRLCIRAMEEYLEQGYTSEYFPVSVELINQENVSDYERAESEEQ